MDFGPRCQLLTCMSTLFGPVTNKNAKTSKQVTCSALTALSCGGHVYLMGNSSPISNACGIFKLMTNLPLLPAESHVQAGRSPLPSPLPSMTGAGSGKWRSGDRGIPQSRNELAAGPKALFGWQACVVWYESAYRALTQHCDSNLDRNSFQPCTPWSNSSSSIVAIMLPPPASA